MTASLYEHFGLSHPLENYLDYGPRNGDEPGADEAINELLRAALLSENLTSCIYHIYHIYQSIAASKGRKDLVI